MTIAWVVGSRGMLGSAVARAVAHDAAWQLFDPPHFAWNESPERLSERASENTGQLIATAVAAGERWCIIWAAGAGVTATSEKAFDDEYDQLAAIFGGVRDAVNSAHSTDGSIFYASSAGSVYAGSARPPFTESTAPVSISPYGRFKLRAEELIAEVAAEASIPSLLGRIANLYGPGQRLDKLQGVISHIALARLTARPASIYVPLDTLRDYIFVDDCAILILECMDRLATTGGSVTKILASGQATTIASLLGHFRAVSRGRPRVVLGSSAAGAMQAHDLRLRSTVWPDLDARRTHSLPAGIQSTVAGILTSIQNGSVR